MNSKQRIRKIFTHKLPDRIGIFDFFDELTIINWKEQLLLPDIEPVEYFDFDLDFRIENSTRTKFVFLCFDGPFQQLASKKGLQQSLVDFTREPRHIKDFFKSSLSNIFSEYKRYKEKGRTFDGIWLCEDIAYDNGLYFSIEKYKEQLFDFHTEIGSYFQDQGVFVVFHCDGNIEQLIPSLIKSNFSGVHPLQESSNPNIIRIKKDLKGAIAFIGGIGLGRLRLLGLSPELDTSELIGSDPILERIEELKEGGDYIFCFDGPIPNDTEFKIYQRLLAETEGIGTYS